MRRVIQSVMVLSAISLAGACTTAPPAALPGPTPAEMVAAADALDQRFLEAFNKADVDALAATYWNSPKVVSFGPDGMGTQGWEAAKGGSVEMFKAMPGAKLEFLTGHNEAEGNVVLGWGTWKMTIPTPAGPQVMEGRYSDVKAMKDGKWVYLMDHASVPLPPAPPEPVKK